MGGKGSYKPAMAMVGLQITYAGVALFTRAALLAGLSPMVFVVYRQAIATFFMSSASFFSRRRSSCKPSLGLKGFSWIFLASFLGVTVNQNLYFEGLYLSSSSMTSAMTNLMPAVTFVVATIIGLEKINIRNMRSIAKIIGTVVCVGGAICMALLKGPKLLNAALFLPANLLGMNVDSWMMGCLFLLGSTVCWSLWLIFQVPISANCPDHCYTSAWMCFLATLESAIVAVLFGKKDLGSWNLDSFLKISCCLYGGIALAVSFFVQSWCVSQRGPLFCAMFNPLCTVIVTFLGALYLHEPTYIGSLLGALAVIIGLYIVLWGKAEDLQDTSQETNPDLQNDQMRPSDYVPVLINEDYLDKEICSSDLSEPLVSDKTH